MCFEAWKVGMYSASHVDEATSFRRFDCQAMGPCRQNATMPYGDQRVPGYEA